MPRLRALLRRRARADRRYALAYRNDEIVHKFTTCWQVSQDEATELFGETLRLLWVVALSRRRGKPFKIDPAFFILDQMWHTFVLFTPEYRAYCHRAFGRFLEHTPTTRAERDASRAELEQDPEGFAKRTLDTHMYKWRLVRDTFGEETLIKWWVEIPTRYGNRFFETAAIPLASTYRPPEPLVQLVQRRAVKQQRRA